MNTDRRKELREAYKNRKPLMGVVSLRCVATDERFFGIATDTKAEFNSLQAKLSGGQHPNKHLQGLWNTYGSEGFELSTVQTLDYKNVDEVSTEDLEELRELCLAEDPSARKIWK